MNQTLKELYDRRSVRAFTDQPICAEDREQILSAALQAPTAGNMTLYTILEITDPALKQRLSITCDHQPFIATAPMALVFCADHKRWYDTFCKYVDVVRAPDVGDLFLAQADALIAAQNVVVAAESLGIGSCYIGDITENFETHRQILGLPDHVVPAAMLVLGHPTQQQCQRPKPPRFAAEDIVHTNGYDANKAARMPEMLRRRQGLGEQDFADWIRKFCQRKWNSDFSVEMSRSCKEIINYFCKGDKTMFVNYAHRGASHYAPENTMPSFDLGVTMGANGIETDLQETKDGQIVMFHDDTIDEKSTGTGAIADHTYQELLEMDFGAWKDEKYAGTKIVLFEDFAKKFLPLDMTFAIELKVTGIAKKSLDIMKKYGNMDNIYVSSFKYEALVETRELDPDVKLTWLIKDPINEENIAKLKEIGGTQISPRATLVTPEQIELAKSHGLRVRLWGVKDEEIMKAVYPLDTDGMTVNFPDKLKELMDAE